MLPVKLKQKKTKKKDVHLKEYIFTKQTNCLIILNDMANMEFNSKIIQHLPVKTRLNVKTKYLEFSLKIIIFSRKIIFYDNFV